jgi:hypothetical protein
VKKVVHKASFWGLKIRVVRYAKNNRFFFLFVIKNIKNWIVKISMFQKVTAKANLWNNMEHNLKNSDTNIFHKF